LSLQPAATHTTRSQVLRGRWVRVVTGGVAGFPPSLACGSPVTTRQRLAVTRVQARANSRFHIHRTSPLPSGRQPHPAVSFSSRGMRGVHTPTGIAGGGVARFGAAEKYSALRKCCHAAGADLRSIDGYLLGACRQRDPAWLQKPPDDGQFCSFVHRFWIDLMPIENGCKCPQNRHK
jgi:hypothetical protein